MNHFSSENAPMVTQALKLMREAVMLLDPAGATLAACRLQGIIDTLDPSPPWSGEESATVQ